MNGYGVVDQPIGEERCQSQIRRGGGSGVFHVPVGFVETIVSDN